MTRFKMFASLMVLGACFVATQGYAAGGGGSHMDPANIDPDNVASLQRGARNFMNYCSGCHSAQYVRYNTIGKTLNLSEEQLIDNLMFNADKTFETIQAAMPAADGARWYGKAPPDLSLMARARRSFGMSCTKNVKRHLPTYLRPKRCASWKKTRSHRYSLRTMTTH